MGFLSLLPQKQAASFGQANGDEEECVESADYPAAVGSLKSLHKMRHTARKLTITTLAKCAETSA